MPRSRVRGSFASRKMFPPTTASSCWRACDEDYLQGPLLRARLLLDWPCLGLEICPFRLAFAVSCFLVYLEPPFRNFNNSLPLLRRDRGRPPESKNRAALVTLPQWIIGAGKPR